MHNTKTFLHMATKRIENRVLYIREQNFNWIRSSLHNAAIASAAQNNNDNLISFSLNSLPSFGCRSCSMLLVQEITYHQRYMAMSWIPLWRTIQTDSSVNTDPASR